MIWPLKIQPQNVQTCHMRKIVVHMARDCECDVAMQWQIRYSPLVGLQICDGHGHNVLLHTHPLHSKVHAYPCKSEIVVMYLPCCVQFTNA